MDVVLFKQQLRLLRKLKRTKATKLRALHERKFKGTKWYVQIPKWMSRDTVIRRLHMLYCYQNYHYPDDHPITEHFRKKADSFLSPSNMAEVRKDEEARIELRDLDRFSKRYIETMPIATVDRYLAALNQHIKAPENFRRRVLWELFNKPQGELIQLNNARGKKVRRVRKGRVSNQKVLKDLVLNNPTMCFNEFFDTYGPVMPTVTRQSFNTTRYLLKRDGHHIEPLPMGRTQHLGQGEEDGEPRGEELD